mgnify:CR=1 FL=1
MGAPCGAPRVAPLLLLLCSNFLGCEMSTTASSLVVWLVGSGADTRGTTPTRSAGVRSGPHMRAASTCLRRRWQASRAPRIERSSCRAAKSRAATSRPTSGTCVGRAGCIQRANGVCSGVRVRGAVSATEVQLRVRVRDCEFAAAGLHARQRGCPRTLLGSPDLCVNMHRTGAWSPSRALQFQGRERATQQHVLRADVT